MKLKQLSNTSLKVSEICLGTMTFGKQNTEADGHSQLDYAIEQGINFIDTAEIYAVPTEKETQGATEKIIGTWLKKSGKRKDIILASKVAGPTADGWLEYLRGGPQYTKQQMTEALNNSLQRLQTDYIDLYQLHWPGRPTNFFGKLGYKHKSDDPGDIRGILEILHSFIEDGKIRYIGLSNETSWGFMTFIKLAERYNLPKVVSIQNPYSLLNRVFEIGNAEISIREKVGLLAYSPLAFGLLSGKYFTDPDTKGRINLFPKLARYNNTYAKAAAKKYVELAHENNLSPSQMALAFVNSREFLTSNIIGATTMEQLKENIESIHVTLSSEVIEKIEEIHKEIPNPAP